MLDIVYVKCFSPKDEKARLPDMGGSKFVVSPN